MRRSSLTHGTAMDVVGNLRRVLRGRASGRIVCVVDRRHVLTSTINGRMNWPDRLRLVGKPMISPSGLFTGIILALSQHPEIGANCVEAALQHSGNLPDHLSDPFGETLTRSAQSFRQEHHESVNVDFAVLGTKRPLASSSSGGYPRIWDGTRILGLPLIQDGIFGFALVCSESSGRTMSMASLGLDSLATDSVLSGD